MAFIYNKTFAGEAAKVLLMLKKSEKRPKRTKHLKQCPMEVVHGDGRHLAVPYNSSFQPLLLRVTLLLVSLYNINYARKLFFIRSINVLLVFSLNR